MKYIVDNNIEILLYFEDDVEIFGSIKLPDFDYDWCPVHIHAPGGWGAQGQFVKLKGAKKFLNNAQHIFERCQGIEEFDVIILKGDILNVVINPDYFICKSNDNLESERLKLDKKSPIIHTIGDSHSHHGWPRYIENHWLNDRLCYSVGRDGLDINVNEGDTVIFCFGEIDCRCHVHKYQNIDYIVKKYFEVISNLPLKNVKICIYNIVPPTRKDDTNDNPEYPFTGTDEERKGYQLYFNKKLKEGCEDYGYIFFDIYDKYIDDNGFLIRELSDGTVYIADGKYISEFLLSL
jgi:hypothetical protein